MNKYWYQEQVRILQTVLREKDAAQYDAAAVVRYMKETDSNCLVVNAGGVMDFFPNKTELGRPGRFLGSQDILKSLVKECHENQLRIIVRVDFRGVEKERYEQKPHWFDGMSGFTCPVLPAFTEAAMRRNLSGSCYRNMTWTACGKTV